MTATVNRTTPQPLIWQHKGARNAEVTFGTQKQSAIVTLKRALVNFINGEDYFHSAVGTLAFISYDSITFVVIVARQKLYRSPYIVAVSYDIKVDLPISRSLSVLSISY